MNKRVFAIVGIVASILLIAFGAMALSDDFGGSMYSVSGANASLYDSGYASFGADFYTYVTNNAATAASAATVTASNIRGLNETVKTVAGYGFIGFGLMGVAHFGMDFAETSNATKKEKDKKKTVTDELPNLDDMTTGPVPPSPVVQAVVEESESNGETIADEIPAVADVDATVAMPKPVDSDKE